MIHHLLVSKMGDLVNPFEDDVWGLGEPLTMEEVDQANPDEGDQPFAGLTLDLPSWSRKQHADRVAYLALWGPCQDPIEVDVGCLGYHPPSPILDGHHRLAAAIYRGDPTIPAYASGDLKFIRDLEKP